MSIDDRVLELLQRYEKLRGQGKHVTAEELCAECPELIGDVRAGIGRLQGLQPLFSTTDGVEDPIPTTAALPDTEVERVGRDSAGARYKILRPHARGGLGEIFVAVDQELHRVVALKRILKGGRLDRASHRWFLREAEVTARLEHPGVVPIYDLQYDSDGHPYYIMKFIEGESLEAAIKRFHEADQYANRDPGERTLALRELLNRFIDVCNTIAYVHSRGVLHRDLKPSNIMLGKYGETLVVDWGLTKPFEWSEGGRADDEDSIRLLAVKGGERSTRVGDVKGTPGYMSPEQASGRIDEVGPASDIFALGATLYAILTGIGPFQGPNALYKASRCQFVAPRQVNPGVPAALEAICLKAMELEPQDRYQSAKALADDAERWLADEPIVAPREPWADTIRRWARRRRPLVVGFAIAGILLLMTASYLFGQLDQVRRNIALPYALQPFYPVALVLLVCGLLWLAWQFWLNWMFARRRPLLAAVLVAWMFLGLFLVLFFRLVPLLSR